MWGVVSEAVDADGRRVAVKELHASLVADPAAHERFGTIAPLLKSIDHPHVVRVLDYADAGGRCALVLDLVEGGTLRQRVDSHVSPEVAVALLLAVASGVDRAARAGVLHRDLKPENVLFTSTGVPAVSDFGMAEIVSGRGTLATRDGAVLGAPAYMAPELVRSEEPGPAADVYAMATILYELLAARLPFSTEGDPLTVMGSHVRDVPDDLLTVATDVPPAISGVVMRGLEPDPVVRYAGADEFGAALADAAARAWGPGWLRNTGVSVTASEAVTARLTETRALEALPPAETIAPPATTAASPPAPPPTDVDQTVAVPRVTPEAVSPVPSPAAAKPRASRWGLIGAIAAVVVIAVVALVVFLGSGGGPTTTTLGPTAVHVSGRQAWTDTGIVLRPADDVSITATGTVFPDAAFPQFAATPDGVPNHPEFRKSNVVGDVDHSGLIGRVGDAGAPFVVGHFDQFKAQAAGRLFLGINDQGIENNGGAFDANVTVTRKK